jgi:hypothetical protein
MSVAPQTKEENMKTAGSNAVNEAGSLKISGRKVILCYRGKIHSFKNSKGMKYLAILLSHQDLPVPWQQLEQLDNGYSAYQAGWTDNSEPEVRALSPACELPPYQLADQQTLKEVKQRMNQIIAELAEADSWNDYSRKDDLLDEQEKLLSYLKEVYLPNGRKRFFPNEFTLQRKRILKALRRALSEIEAVEPKLAYELKASLHLEELWIYRPRGNPVLISGY